MIRSSMKESPPPTPSVAPPWIDLPLDVTANILQRLDAVELLHSVQLVCATWWKVCHDPAMWRVIKIVCPKFNKRYECACMCRRAVDLSQGKHTDLTIVCFGNDELLDYIANRSGNLRSLTIACPYNVSATGLTEAVKKLTELEELHLILPPILSEYIETIGVSCPKLKSFSFNKILSRDRLLDFFQGVTPQSSVNAVAIAKSMPNLCHLGILGNDLNNEGLEAILDGCPCLESLDLRRCFILDLGGALGQRCRDKIKYLRLPSDSLGDYEWKDTVELSDYLTSGNAVGNVCGFGGNVGRDVDFGLGRYGYSLSEFEHGSASAGGVVDSDSDHGSASADGVVDSDSDSDSVCSEANGSATVCSEVDSDYGSGSVCGEVDFDNSSGSVCSEADFDNGSGSVCSEVDTNNGLSCSGDDVFVESGLNLRDFEQMEDPSPLFDSVGEVDFDNGSGSVCSEVYSDNGLSSEVVCVESGLNLHDFEEREDPSPHFVCEESGLNLDDFEQREEDLSPRFDSVGEYYWSGRCDFGDEFGYGNDYGDDGFELGNDYDDGWSDY